MLLYIAKATGNKEDAEEIVHDIFISIWENRANLHADTNLSSLLFSIAYKRRIDFFRRSLHKPIYEDYMQFHNELTADEHNQLEYNDFCNIFNKALQQVPARFQTLLALSRIHGLTTEEIAHRLNISQKTVQNGISQGLKLLREHLDNYRKKFNC